MTKWLWFLLIISLSCFAGSLIDPEYFWPAIFFSLITPFILILNVGLIIVLAIRRERKIVFPIIALTSGIFFTGRTIVFHANDSISKTDISVLSFNAKFFRKQNTYQQFSAEMIQWVVGDTSMIKCIQEYSTNKNWMGLDVTGKLEEQGYHGFVIKSKKKDNDHSNGIAIFSRYKITDGGVVIDTDTMSNAVIFVDLTIGNDTIRIYNAHLESMNLGQGSGVLSKLKNGSIVRSQQVAHLVRHAKASPYPVIICGDFNETPYGHSYRQLVTSFENSFERGGNGFGFTLHSILFFLRIDHQFFGHGLALRHYRVARSMDISDHYPTFGYYHFQK